MAWNQESRGHEMVYLASGIAIGAIGASLVLSDNGARRKLTQAMGMETPKQSSFLWPWGRSSREAWWPPAWRASLRKLRGTSKST